MISSHAHSRLNGNLAVLETNRQFQKLELRKKCLSTNAAYVQSSEKQWHIALPNLSPWNWIFRMMFLQDCSPQALLTSASDFWPCALKPNIVRCKLATTARKKFNRQHSKLECDPQSSDRPKQAALGHVRSWPEYASQRSSRKEKVWPQNSNWRAQGASAESEVQHSNVWTLRFIS